MSPRREFIPVSTEDTLTATLAALEARMTRTEVWHDRV